MSNMQMTAEPMGVHIPNVIALTARSAQVLAEEADKLQEMKISDIEPLQKEKLMLTSALERQKKFLDQNPQALADMDDDERDELRTVVEIFEAVVAENYRRLLMAKEVNLKMVEAIADAVTESSSQGTYDENGMPESGQPMSITLNKTI